VSYGIDIAASEALVEANHIVHRGGNFRAIRLCGNDSRASGNVILAESEAASAAVAIVAGHDNAANSLLISQVSITGNIAEGRQNGIVLANVQESDISGNLLGRRGGPLALIGIALNNCEDCTVADNRIAPTAVGILALSGARNRITGNRIDGGAIGIASGLEQAVTISGCAINGARTMGVIALGISQRCTIIENRLIACGSGAATAVGIGGLLIMGEWHVEANEVMNTGLSPDGAGAQAAIAYGISGDLILEARIESNLVTYSGMDLRPVAGEDRALRLRGLLEYRIDLAAGPVVLGAAAQVVDNKFIGPGASALVELFEAQINDNVFIRFERAMFTGNFCSHFTGQPGGEAATVHLTGRALTVANNQVKATFRSFPSWHLHNRRGPFNGNVSHGPTLGRAAANQFPAPENAFNLIV
jgi:parallel beta-helix repeat protein